MIRKYTTIIVLFAFLNNLVLGCSKTTVVQKAELNEETSKCCVHELVLTTGEKFEFKDPGGHYQVVSYLVTGTLNDGRRVFFDLSGDNITELRVSTGKIVSPHDLTKDPDQKISEIRRGNDIYTFDRNGGKVVKEVETIHGITSTGMQMDVPIDDILSAKIKRVDAARSSGAALGVILVAVGALAIGVAVASCPLIYSYDGKQYVFDAEPLGGAVSKGLQKNDYSRLEHVKAVNHSYRLLFRNELKETQHLDEIKLLVFDHNAEDIIIPDLSGNFYKISSPVVSSRATDEKGKNLNLFLNYNDGVAWQTNLPKTHKAMIDFQRHQIIMEFPRPPGVTQANLVVNAGTALWGSNMMHEMLQLRGDRVDDWYRAIDAQGPELLELYYFIDREELYLLKIHIKKGDHWVEQEFIPGGGPLVTEDRVIPLDLSGISGDKLLLRLEPPPGFWQIDYIAIDYGASQKPVGSEVPLKTARDQSGKEITSVLRQADDVYHQMPQLNDWFEAEFAAPEQKPGMKRSIFLKSTGYYEIRLDKSQPEQTELIKTLIHKPGEIVDYSNKRYAEWVKEQFRTE